MLLKDGNVAADGPPRDVLTEANLAAVYGVRATIGELTGLPVVLARTGDMIRPPQLRKRFVLGVCRGGWRTSSGGQCAGFIDN